MEDNWMFCKIDVVSMILEDDVISKVLEIDDRVFTRLVLCQWRL